MRPNPVLRKLGFSADDRVVIIHVDDVGMCQASVDAFRDLQDFGLISSGAVMTPCPWFLEAAGYARTNPAADLGVHLTLTSEWKTYRWGPVSTCNKESGLIDEEGYFFHDVPPVHANADPAAVQAELTAQIEMALKAGMAPTHADTHMGAVAHIRLIPVYLQVACQFGLPPMLFRMDEAGWRATGLDAETAQMAGVLVQNLEDNGLPLLDAIHMMSLEAPDNRLDLGKRTLAALPPGITHFIIHAAKDTPELRAITPDWPSRVADYQTFCSEELRKFVKEAGIQVIGYRSIKELMPRG